MTNKFTLALLAGMLLAGPAIAAGMWTNGSPQVPIVGTTTQPGNYPQMTGNELLPFDTGLPAGAYPQSAAVNLAQLSMFAAAMGDSSTTATGTGSTSTATLNAVMGTVVSGAITTAAGATHTMTITNSTVTAASKLQYAVYNLGNTAGVMRVTSVTPGSGSFVVVFTNVGTAAVNGTIDFAFVVQ